MTSKYGGSNRRQGKGDTAMVAVLAPQFRIDVPGRIERRHELVAVARRACRIFLGAGEIEPDALEHMRQAGHERLH